MINNYLKQKTPCEIDLDIALRLRDIQKRLKLSQKKISEKSGVSLGSLKRFENTGDISLISLTKLAIILNCESELESLFTTVHPLEENMPPVSMETAVIRDRRYFVCSR